MAQWWELSPPTNVSRVRFQDPASYVGWVCCWFSSLLREIFLRVLRFSPLLKNQHFQIPIRAGLLSALCHEPLARVIAQALPVFDIKFAFTVFFFLHSCNFRSLFEVDSMHRIRSGFLFRSFTAFVTKGRYEKHIRPLNAVWIENWKV